MEQARETKDKAPIVRSLLKIEDKYGQLVEVYDSTAYELMIEKIVLDSAGVINQEISDRSFFSLGNILNKLDEMGFVPLTKDEISRFKEKYSTNEKDALVKVDNFTVFWKDPETNESGVISLGLQENEKSLSTTEFSPDLEVLYFGGTHFLFKKKPNTGKQTSLNLD